MASPSQRGLLVKIDKEELVPGPSIEPSSSDFFSDLDLLTPHVKDNEAAYIILRRYPDASDSFIAVTYVPDAAPVRQKMLFASTRLTLIRELGIERFRETIFATTKAELTADGFRKHDKHVELEAPLTEEEQTLGAVKRAESEEGRGSSVKRSHISDHFAMPISDDAMGALKKLGDSESGDNLVQLVRPIYRPPLLFVYKCQWKGLIHVLENQHLFRNDRAGVHIHRDIARPLYCHLVLRAPLLLLQAQPRCHQWLFLGLYNLHIHLPWRQ